MKIQESILRIQVNNCKRKEKENTLEQFIRIEVCQEKSYLHIRLVDKVQNL